MSDVMMSILTDQTLRDEQAVDALLKYHAKVADVWANQ